MLGIFSRGRKADQRRRKRTWSSRLKEGRGRERGYYRVTRAGVTKEPAWGTTTRPCHHCSGRWLDRPGRGSGVENSMTAAFNKKLGLHAHNKQKGRSAGRRVQVESPAHPAHMKGKKKKTAGEEAFRAHSLPSR